ncbi:MAG: hypothetical protein V4472_03555 [Pseudomonadota bacterium]
MADADPHHSTLHPAIARAASWPAWTADPAVAQLLAALRDLDALAARLAALHRVRPDLGLESVRGEVGEVAPILERCPERGFDHGWRWRANGGACAGLWEMLGRRRAAWIDARLAVEGFPAHADTRAKALRGMALERAAPPVAMLWEAFRAGVALPR